MRKTFKQKIGEAKRHGIEIPDELESNDKIVQR